MVNSRYRFYGGHKKLEKIADFLSRIGFNVYLGITFLEVVDINDESAGMIARKYGVRLEHAPRPESKLFYGLQ